MENKCFKVHMKHGQKDSMHVIGILGEEREQGKSST